VLRVTDVPALAFALGMYLPMEINTPVLLGGILAWIVQRKRENEPKEVPEARHQQGILIASGLIAGGALMGVINAAAGVGFGPDRMASLHILGDQAFEGPLGEGLAIAMLVALCVLVVSWSKRAARA